ncbi:hypothetical protein JZ785_03040 [Alicyclobacillus curvatus]|nr:hypothetical protein JZ785_03040 [Alicyclobacillus curvatus]
MDFPEEFDTERLVIRSPRWGDGAELNAAIRESIEELRPQHRFAMIFHRLQTRPTKHTQSEFAELRRLSELVSDRQKIQSQRQRTFVSI